MSNQAMILWGVAALLLVLYFMRRRNRLSGEDD